MTIPSIRISFGDLNSSKDFKHLGKNSFFNITSMGHLEGPMTVENNVKVVKVFGYSIINNKIDNQKVARLILAEKLNYSEINGQFLIIIFDKLKDELKIINDRFASYPIYWANLKGIFFACLSYIDLQKMLNKHNVKKKIDKFNFFEFIYLQKLQGDKTYDSVSKYLLPASVLIIRNGLSKRSFYWNQSFLKKDYKNVNQAGMIFSELLKRNIKIFEDKYKKIGLFLSGGHDSRTLLSCMNKEKVEAVTVSFFDNYEVSCARKLAKKKDIKHNFFKLSENHFFDNLELMTEICSGFYSIINALFVDLPKEKFKSFDLLMHGHGLDYMFHGMYLPSQNINVFNSPTFFKRLIDIKHQNIVTFFLENISFRLSNINLFNYLKRNKKKIFYESLVKSSEDVLSLNDTLDSNDSKWEYLLTHCLSRHYSYPNNLSIMTMGKQACVTFENEIFDFFLSLPNKYRIYGELLRYTTHRFGPSMLKVPSGNYGIPVGLSPLGKTVWLVVRKILRNSLGIKSLHTPHASDRTWPDQNEYVFHNKEFNKIVNKSLNSEKLRDILDFFDWKKIDNQFKNSKNLKNKNFGKFLFNLITLERFLQKF